jgi:hypothetical protein
MRLTRLHNPYRSTKPMYFSLTLNVSVFAVFGRHYTNCYTKDTGESGTASIKDFIHWNNTADSARTRLGRVVFRTELDQYDLWISDYFSKRGDE